MNSVYFGIYFIYFVKFSNHFFHFTCNGYVVSDTQTLYLFELTHCSRMKWGLFRRLITLFDNPIILSLLLPIPFILKNVIYFFKGLMPKIFLFQNAYVTPYLSKLCNEQFYEHYVFAAFTDRRNIGRPSE